VSTMNALTGHQIVVAQINRALADAVSWAIQMKAAMAIGDEAAMQHAAAGIHVNAQTAQCLSRMVEKRIAIHRKRHPHE